MGEFVNLEPADGIGTIRLNRPPVNALNDQVTAELAAAAREAAASGEVRAVIIYGGEKVFAGGADIKVMAEAGYAEMALRSGRLQEAAGLVAALPKPVVAAITGYALGGGLELALAADFRVAGERARVGQPEILLGVIPGAGGAPPLAPFPGGGGGPGPPSGVARRGVPPRRVPGRARRRRPGRRRPHCRHLAGGSGHSARPGSPARAPRRPR